MSYSSRNTHRHAWITAHRAAVLVLLLALVAIGITLLVRPAPKPAPSAAEIAQAVNGPAEFQRPSQMEYVAKTNSCIVGGTVVSTTWHVGGKDYPVGGVDFNTKVDYTSFVFQSDEGRTFTVSDNGALFTDPGENLGLELSCDPATVNTATSFGMLAIIWGGK
jgi:hypothetical protein